MPRQPANRPEQLSLLPVMNLVSILIPMLLMSAQVVHLAVIDSTLPGIEEESDEPVEPGLKLSLLITDQGITVAGSEALLPNSEGEGPTLPCSGDPCAGPESYDYYALTELLGQVKDEHPDEATVILVPESRVPYEVIVGVMDAAREDPETIGPDGTPRPLFPNVVVAGGAG